MKPSLKANHNKADLCEAFALDGDQIWSRAYDIFKEFSTVSEALCKAWEEAKSYEEAVCMAYVIGRLVEFMLLRNSVIVMKIFGDSYGAEEYEA